MSKFENDFYIPHDAKIFGGLEYGYMTPGMYSVYSMMLFQCNYERGFWFGSVEKLYVGWGGQIGRKTLERDLSQLYKSGYLKSFRTEGRRGNYAVGIHGYKVRFGKYEGLILEAHQTTNWLFDPIYYTESEFFQHGTDIPFGDDFPTASPAVSPAVSPAASPSL
jgi:hypothetical protein